MEEQTLFRFLLDSYSNNQRIAKNSVLSKQIIQAVFGEKVFPKMAGDIEILKKVDSNFCNKAENIYIEVTPNVTNNKS